MMNLPDPHIGAMCRMRVWRTGPDGYHVHARPFGVIRESIRGTQTGQICAFVVKPIDRPSERIRLIAAHVELRP